MKIVNVTRPKLLLIKPLITNTMKRPGNYLNQCNIRVSTSIYTIIITRTWLKMMI